MRSIAAYIRASWLSASSYRVSMVLSLLGVVGAIIPVYFIAKALQPMMGRVIQGEAHQYFAFVLVGTITFSFIPLAVKGLPDAITSSINNGTMEAVLGTPTSMPVMFAGMMGYSFIWTFVRAVLTLLAGWMLGASIAWNQVPLAVLVLALLIMAYVPIGLISASSYLAFRTAGPIATGVMILSTLLGGVYYPAKAVPAWLQHISGFIPLTYGLRALRKVILEGASLRTVGADVAMLLLMTVVLLGIGLWVFKSAMSYARRIGSLGYY
jgi:ABC-type polysaccharide/polyol phosphate export systems, permease component